MSYLPKLIPSFLSVLISPKGIPQVFPPLTLYIRRPQTGLPCTCPCHWCQKGGQAGVGLMSIVPTSETLPAALVIGA